MLEAFEDRKQKIDFSPSDDLPSLRRLKELEVLRRIRKAVRLSELFPETFKVMKRTKNFTEMKGKALIQRPGERYLVIWVNEELASKVLGKSKIDSKKELVKVLESLLEEWERYEARVERIKYKAALLDLVEDDEFWWETSKGIEFPPWKFKDDIVDLEKLVNFLKLLDEEGMGESLLISTIEDSSVSWHENDSNLIVSEKILRKYVGGARDFSSVKKAIEKFYEDSKRVVKKLKKLKKTVIVSFAGKVPVSADNVQNLKEIGRILRTFEKEGVADLIDFNEFHPYYSYYSGLADHVIQWKEGKMRIYEEIHKIWDHPRFPRNYEEYIKLHNDIEKYWRKFTEEAEKRGLTRGTKFWWEVSEEKTVRLEKGRLKIREEDLVKLRKQIDVLKFLSEFGAEVRVETNHWREIEIDVIPGYATCKISKAILKEYTGYRKPSVEEAIKILQELLNTSKIRNTTLP